ncbi:MAG TPA: stage II sporulation protein M [Candidatus Nanoarchaeia archaeon]|nr:stage II sporulation protein M [Candidatus Nanoarchaeia archaeon]
MVLEALFNPFVVKKKPFQMFWAGFLYSIIGMMLSYFVFQEIAGILTVFLIVIGSLPLLYTTIKNEEELDLKYKEVVLLREHTKVLVFLMFLFLGITSALTMAYVFLPIEITGTLFNIQEQAILNVNSAIQARLTGYSIGGGLFIKIFLNNIKVMFFCIIFSLLYGAGALFILTWNASVIATAIGNFIRSEISATASLVGFSVVSAYFKAGALGFFRYMLHGVFEIGAYFVAALAGGIVSIALIKQDARNEKVFLDALNLLIISLGLLFFGSLVEVFVTPIFFS